MELLSQGEFCECLLSNKSVTKDIDIQWSFQEELSNLWPGIARGEGCVVVVVVQLSPDELLNVFRLGVGGGKTLPKIAKCQWRI